MFRCNSKGMFSFPPFYIYLLLLYLIDVLFTRLHTAVESAGSRSAGSK